MCVFEKERDREKKISFYRLRQIYHVLNTCDRMKEKREIERERKRERERHKIREKDI